MLPLLGERERAVRIHPGRETPTKCCHTITAGTEQKNPTNRPAHTPSEIRKPFPDPAGVTSSTRTFTDDQLRRRRPADPQHAPGPFPGPRQATAGSAGPFDETHVPDPGPSPSEGRSAPPPQYPGSPAPPRAGPPADSRWCTRIMVAPRSASRLGRRSVVPISRDRRRIPQGPQANSGRDQVPRPCPRRRRRATRSRNCRYGRESEWQ